MSTSNLLHPNDYDLYAGTMTTTYGAQSFRQLLAQTTLVGTADPLPVITSWSIHGATGAVNMLGGLMTYIDYAIQANKNDTIVTATIPSFSITTIANDTHDVTTIKFAIPASVTPTSSSSPGLTICWGGATLTTQNIVTVKVLNTGFIEIKSINGALLYDHVQHVAFGTDSTGLGGAADMVVTWEL